MVRLGKLLRLEMKRERIVVELLDKYKYEWVIEPRYWRNPLLASGVVLLMPLLLSLEFLLTGRPGLTAWLSTLIIANAYAAMALPLMWMTLGTGRVNFGPQMILAVGGFTAGLLSIHLGLSSIQTLPLAAGACLALGLLYALLAIVSGGLYYVLVTMLIPLCFLQVVFASDILGRDQGLLGIAPLTDILSFHGRPSPTFTLMIHSYISIALLFVNLLITHRFIHSRYGLMMAAINEDEDVAAAVGVNVKKIKLLSTVVPSTMIGVVGWFFAHYYKTFAGTNWLPVTTAARLLLIIIIGGRGEIYGCIMGAYFIILLEVLLSRYLGPLYPPILFMVLLGALFLLPEGLWSLYRKRRYREYLATIKVRKTVEE